MEDAVSYRRFWLAFAAWLAGLACVAGSTTVFEFVFGLRKFGGMEYTSRVHALSLVREVSAGSVSSAALFAWITWAHGVEAAVVRSRFKGLALRVLLSAPVAHGVGVVLGTLAGFVVGVFAFEISPEMWIDGYRRVLGPADWAVGVGLAISGLAVVIIVSFLMMPRLARVVWGLPRKIVTVWTALFVLRGFVSIVDAVLWK